MTDISPESVESTSRYSLRAIFLIAVIFVVAAPAFWLRTESREGEMTAAYENAGLYREIYPSLHYGFGRLRAGEVPLWNPKQLCGTPFYSNPAHGLFQPLNIVFALLPTERALAVHAFLCLSLMGTFAALLARSFGAGYVAAMLCGVGYAFSGASSAAMSRPALAACLAWAPLALWGLREYGRTFGAGAAIVTAVSLALLALSGANAAVVAFVAVLVPYAILVVLFPSPKTAAPRLLARIEGLVAIAAGGLALSAIQWMPTLAWALTLDQPLRAVFRFDLPGVLPTSFEDLVGQLLVPRPGKLPRVAYLGALVLPVIPAALATRRHRWEALFFLVAAVVSLVLGAGGTPPLPSGFSGGAFLLPGMLCLALLVGLGFDRLLVSGEPARRPRIWFPTIVTIATMGALFYLTVSEPRGRIVVLLFVLIPVLVVRRRWMSAIGGAVLALLLYMDLTAASVNMYRHPLSDAPGCFHRYPSTLRTMEEQALGARVLTSSPVLDFGLPANVGMLFPFIHAAGGEMPLTKEQAVWWRRLGPNDAATTTGPAAATIAETVPAAANPKLLDFMAVRVLAAAPTSAMYAGTWANPRPAFQELRTEDSARIFFNGNALPRALWTSAWRSAEGVASAADLLASASFDGTLECVIDRDSEGYAELAALVPGPRAEASPPEPVAGTSCLITEDLPERVTLHVSAPCAGVAVLADTYAPGWKARLNGVECPILRANGLFRGVAVPAGDNDIVFEYQPLAYSTGLALSLIAAGFFSLAGLIWLLRR